MRSLNITDQNQRDSPVAFEPVTPESSTSFALASGDSVQSVKIIKNTFRSDLTAVARIAERRGKDIVDLLIESDPEIDFDYTGKISTQTKTIYLDEHEHISYNVRFKESIYDPDGKELTRRDYVRLPSNISGDEPLSWSGKFIPARKAIRQFVFGKIYQLRHVNGLTYDFLYGMARILHEKRSFMRVGAGPKGKDPLRFSRGGPPYHAFLFGSVREDAYRLSLHLTNLELKDFE